MIDLLEAEMGNKDAAKTALVAATQADPAFTGAWYNLGLPKAASGNIDDAIFALRKAEETNPSSPPPPSHVPPSTSAKAKPKPSRTPLAALSKSAPTTNPASNSSK